MLNVLFFMLIQKNIVILRHEIFNGKDIKIHSKVTVRSSNASKPKSYR
jgi:hypothetical protein